MKAIQVHDASKAQATSLHWTSVPIPKLSSNQVLVRVKAFGLNRMDILQRMGLYPVPPGASHIIGIEFSGIVEDANGQCDWENGDQVFGLTTGGAYAELVAVHPRLLVKKASKLTWVQAAGSCCCNPPGNLE